MSRDEKSAIVWSCVGAVLVFAAFGAFSVFCAWNEARTYSRLTGANVTTWDALWVDFRIQEGVSDEPRR